MNAKKTVPLILCISLFLSGCSVAISPKASSIAENYNLPRESRENENILEAKKILAEINIEKKGRGIRSTLLTNIAVRKIS